MAEYIPNMREVSESQRYETRGEKYNAINEKDKRTRKQVKQEIRTEI